MQESATKKRLSQLKQQFAALENESGNGYTSPLSVSPVSTRSGSPKDATTVANDDLETVRRMLAEAETTRLLRRYNIAAMEPSPTAVLLDSPSLRQPLDLPTRERGNDLERGGRKQQQQQQTPQRDLDRSRDSRDYRDVQQLRGSGDFTAREQREREKDRLDQQRERETFQREKSFERTNGQPARSPLAVSAPRGDSNGNRLMDSFLNSSSAKDEMITSLQQQQRIKQLELDLARAQHIAETAELRCAGSEAACLQLQKQVQQLQEQNNEHRDVVQKAFDGFRELNESAMSDFEALREELETLKDRNAVLESSNQTMTAQLRALEVEKTASDRSVAAGGSRSDSRGGYGGASQISVLHAAQSALQQEQAKVSMLTAKQQQWETERDQMQRELQMKMNVIDLLKREVEVAQTKANEARAELQRVIETVQVAHNEEAEHLRAQLRERDEQLSELQLSLHDATNTLLQMSTLHASRTMTRPQKL